MFHRIHIVTKSLCLNNALPKSVKKRLGIVDAVRLWQPEVAAEQLPEGVVTPVADPASFLAVC